jgi:Tol biopolymer transport system component
MNDRQWREAWEIFRTARDLAGEERRSFLSSLHTDPDVFEEVTAMLKESVEDASYEAPSKIGTRFGRYKILEKLGSGGMGEVYSAQDAELDRMVALKFLSAEMAASRSAVERLVREAKAASALNHPHIVTVYEVIHTTDDVAIAMELVEGAAVRKSCGKPNEISRTIDWGRQVAQALAAAHHRNIIHRDIKPENLMVRTDGILKVLDFGLARKTGLADLGGLTNPSAPLAGTLRYMAPEQTRAEPATSASDIFALGIVLFELVTGTHPFRADSPIDTGYAIAHAEPKAPSVLNPAVPPAMNTLLLAMLDKDPGKRPSALEVDRRLANLNVATTGKPPRRILRVSAMVLAMALAGFVLLSYRERIFPSKEPVLTQLTVQVNENRVTAVAVSPDGKTLAFAAFGGSVFLRRMSDSFSHSLSTPAGLRVDRIAWFHDGSKLLVSGIVGGDNPVGDFQAGIWILAVEGGEPRKIISDGVNGVPSPDGTRVALTSSDKSIVWVAAADGSGPRQIRSGGRTSSFSSLIWSADSKRVAYERRDYVAGDRQSNAKLAQLYNSFRYNYESADVETGQAAAAAKDFDVIQACGLPDGRVLLVGRLAAEPNGTRHLWELRMDPGTGKLLKPPRLLTRNEDPSLSGISASDDGKQVVVVRDLRSFPNIYIADLPQPGQAPNLLNRRRLTFSESDEYPHAWTTDSRTLVFESNRAGHFDLYRQDIDRREPEPIVVSPLWKVMARLAPDGQTLLYRESRDGVGWKVMRIPLQGGTPEPVLADENVNQEFRCGLQAGTQCVLRTVEGDQFVFYELKPLHGKGRELARTGWSPTILGDWDLSPDGTQAVIPNHDSHHAELRLIALDSGRSGIEEKRVTLNGLKNLNGIVWDAAGRGWYVSTRTDSGGLFESGGLLFYVDLQGRISKLLDSMSPTYVVPSPDGRLIAFPDWTVSSNAWLFHGL